MSGLREKPDEIAFVVDTVIAPAGQQPIPWPEQMFNQWRETYLSGRPCLLANSDATGLTAEFPFGTESSLVEAKTDQTHPLVGKGLWLLNSFGLDEIPNKSGLHALLLNAWEIEHADQPFFGSWCEPEDGRVDFITFVPSVMKRPSVAGNAVILAVGRARFMSVKWLGDDWSETWDEQGRCKARTALERVAAGEAGGGQARPRRRTTSTHQPPHQPPPSEAKTIFQYPPLDRLTRDEAMSALVTFGDDTEGLKQAFGWKVKPNLLVKFYRELKQRTILSLEFYHMSMRDITHMGYLWHPRKHCGIIYITPGGFAEISDDCVPSVAPIQSLDSSHLAQNLAKIMSADGWMPLNLEADEVELHPGAITSQDLVKALADGVFASEEDIENPIQAAEEWVARHTKAAKKQTRSRK